ncbi:MAG: NAD(P)/FAD-dependent oxidoreductase [Terriglobales bacterium]
MRYDLAVVGGGPAGSVAAAVAARRGLRVIAFERGSFPRDKVCGEFVSSEALPLLQTLAPRLCAAAPGIARAAFVAPSGRRRGFDLLQPALGISRLALDAALWEAAAGAERRTRATVAAFEPEGSHWRLRLAGGETLAAAAVIVASGRSGRASPWLGVKARFHGLEAGAAVEMHLFRGGYCGLAPVENGWTNVCALIHRRRAGALGASRDFAAWISAASASPALAQRLRPGRQATPTVVTAQLELGSRAGCRDGVLAAGDASGFIDPFTGDGLARALLSGELAADAIANGATQAYPAALARAAACGYTAAAPLRRLVQAPLRLQSLAAWALARPVVGPRLLAATRWRS